jgi:hypothetical protein
MTVREASEEAVTPWRRFVGANIKGTPAMSADKVGADVEVLRRTASIVVTQETRWSWYWRRIGRVLAIVLQGRPPRRRRRAALSDRWKTAPGIAKAIARPGRAASAVMWKGRHWGRARTMVRLLHRGARKITEARWLRAVLLVDWDTQLGVWAGTCHFVVGADGRDDRRRRDFAKRRRILLRDLDRFDAFLGDLVATGHPVLFQLDANIGPTSEDEIRAQLIAIIRRRGGRVIGFRGVEWLIVIDGADVEVEVRDPGGWIIRAKARGGRLNTDHEARGVTFRLVRKSR